MAFKYLFGGYNSLIEMPNKKILVQGKGIMDKIINIIRQAFASMAMTSEEVFNIFFSLLLAFLIALVVSQVYKMTHRGVNYESTFMTSLVLLAPIVAVVMMFIGGNLVLSLGLVGSLSIIRFRTPIKDTRDMVFLFWSIAVGLGAGTYSWGLVTLSSAFLVAVIFILHLIKYGRSQNNDFILVVSGTSDNDGDKLIEIIRKYTKESKIRSQRISDDMWEIIFELRFSDERKILDSLVKELKAVSGVGNVSLLAPQLALPV